MDWPRDENEDSRLPKQTFCSELARGNRRQGGARQSATKTLKNSLRACDIPVKAWEHLAADPSAWRLATLNGAQAFEERRLSQLDTKLSQLDIKLSNCHS